VKVSGVAAVALFVIEVARLLERLVLGVEAGAMGTSLKLRLATIFVS
jgi:hypothetical protein